MKIAPHENPGAARHAAGTVIIVLVAEQQKRQLLVDLPRELAGPVVILLSHAGHANGGFLRLLLIQVGHDDVIRRFIPPHGRG